MKYLEILLTALKLGLTSFGGPMAHLGYFHAEYVRKKLWVTNHEFGELVALCQFLPGPASSQVGLAIGLKRAGLAGALLSWIGFTLPSALFLTLLGLGITKFNFDSKASWLHGLNVTALAIIAQALISMGKKFCTDWTRVTIALCSCILIIFFQTVTSQILVLILSGFLGTKFLIMSPEPINEIINRSCLSSDRKTSFVSLFLYFGLLVLLPILSLVFENNSIQWIDTFYRAGALVFGGGHVVLSLLQAEVVPEGWVTTDLFLAGYSAANAMPGPLFAFSSYLGAVSSQWPNGWLGAGLSLISIFLPSFFLVIGVLPIWEKWRHLNWARQFLLGVNASVVGLLLATFINPVWNSTISTWKDFGIALVAFVSMEYLNAPSWLVMIATISISFILF